MKNNLTSIATIAVYLLFVFGGRAVNSGEVADVESQSYCNAEPSEARYGAFVANDTSVSEICFVDYSEIQTEHIPINVSDNLRSAVIPVDSIRMPVHQVKAASFLKDKSILIAAEPYKRFQLARLCHELMEAGFENPKIALWSPKPGPDSSELIVPADDFLVEAINFGAVTIALDEKVSDELNSLGIASVYPKGEESLDSLLQSASSLYGLSGYLPVFLVGYRDTQPLRSIGSPPVYMVRGGVEEIKTTLSVAALNTIKNSKKDYRGNCAGQSL